MITLNDFHSASSHRVLSASALVDLEATLSTFGSSLSPEAHTAIFALLTTLEAGLWGELPPSYYLSSIDPGTGKTLAVSKFLKAWKSAGFLPAAGVLVCVSRLTEIEAYLASSGLAQEDVAVLTSEASINALGCPVDRHDQAPVMFTTQQRIGYRARKASMAELDGFFFQGTPRALRIWDESALLGESLTVRADDLGALLGPMRSAQPQYVEQLKTFITSIWDAEPGAEITVPDGLGVAKGAAGLSPDRKATLSTLSRLAGSEVRLVDVGKGDVRLAGSTQQLPADFAPAIILDASGRVRETYKLWEEHRGGLIRLPTASNDYRNLTIHLWQRPVGRDRIATPSIRTEVAKAIAEAVQGRPGEEWLVVYYKGAEVLIEAVRGIVGEEVARRVRGLTWGMHHGTNAYADVPNIVVVGQNTYGRADYTALAAAAVGGSLCGLTDDEERALQEGEYAHHVLQALCRSSLRRAVAGRAGAARAYLIQSPRSGIEATLDKTFPGHVRHDWNAGHEVSLTGHAGAMVGFLSERFEADRDSVVSKAEVSQRLRIARPHLSRLLSRSDVCDELDRRGIDVSPRHFRLPEVAFDPWRGATG